MDRTTRSAVSARAGNRCEYCRIHEDDDVFAFHVEHVIAIKHGGSDDLNNLAYACQHCNLHKGPNLAGIDPDTGHLVELFHPRQDQWTDHFTVENFRFIGLTPKGRATVDVLVMNDRDRVRLRRVLE